MGLLAALLYVALYEVFGVGLEDIVDLVKEIIELGFELFALRHANREIVERLFGA